MKKVIGITALLLPVLSGASWYLYSSPHHMSAKVKALAPATQRGSGGNSIPRPAAPASSQSPPVAATLPERSTPPPKLGTDKGFQVKKLLYQSERTDPSGLQIERTEIFDSSFHYPLIRTVSSLERDYTTGVEGIIRQVSMVADHVVVKVKPGLSPQSLANRLRENGLQIRSIVVRDRVYLLQFNLNADDPFPGIVDRLKVATDWVEVVEPDLIVSHGSS